MHVCHVNLSKEFRGGERQTLALIRELDGRIEQSVVVRRNGPLHRELTENDGLAAEIRPVASSVVAATLAASGADLLHVHEGRSVLVGAARSLLGTPFIATRRVLQLPKALGTTRWCYTRARRIVGVSQAVSNAVRSYDERCRLSTIHDCVPHLPQPSPDEVEAVRRRFPGKLLIGQVGQLDDAAKGQGMTLAAARILEARLPDLAFLLLGQGPDAERLRAEAEGLSNVHFEGWVTDVSAFYGALDMLVFPSRSEALGSSILEAMSFGVPVIASEVGGIPEIVQHDVNGLSYPVEDLGLLCRHIERLANDPALRQRLGRQGEATAEGFVASRMATLYLEVYADAVKPEAEADPA